MNDKAKKNGVDFSLPRPTGLNLLLRNYEGTEIWMDDKGHVVRRRESDEGPYWQWAHWRDVKNEGAAEGLEELRNS